MIIVSDVQVDDLFEWMSLGDILICENYRETALQFIQWQKEMHGGFNFQTSDFDNGIFVLYKSSNWTFTRRKILKGFHYSFIVNGGVKTFNGSFEILPSTLV